MGTNSTGRDPFSVAPQLYDHETELPKAATKLASLKEIPRLPPDEPVDGGAAAADEDTATELLAALGTDMKVVDGLAAGAEGTGTLTPTLTAGAVFWPALLLVHDRPAL